MRILPGNAIEQIQNHLLKLQNDLCTAFEDLDEKSKFIEDNWTRTLGGGVLTRILTQGQVFSKAGVNFLISTASSYLLLRVFNGLSWLGEVLKH